MTRFYHCVPIQKLDYYVVRGTRNNGFSSYLENKFQFVSMNDDSSVFYFICWGVPQGSIVGPFIVLIHKDGLHYAIKHCITHHFADDTSL